MKNISAFALMFLKILVILTAFLFLFSVGYILGLFDFLTTETPTSHPEIVSVYSPTSEPPPELEPTYIQYDSDENFFDLPVNGSTGYASSEINLHSTPDINSQIIMSLAQGSAFLILEEIDTWWKIEIDGTQGYVSHIDCLINLPDVLPSAVYNNTNASASVLKSSFIDIPNITGEKLYSAYDYNERLGSDEYIMPVLYATAKKIAHAQYMALQDGNTLIINELYRPYEVQQKIVAELTSLSNVNNEVLKGISTEPWSVNWFIATSVSNHQMGYAVDTTLGKVTQTGISTSGEYEFTTILNYEEYIMQTPIHELSYHSASLAYPISSKNETAWKSVPVYKDFTTESALLRNYCTNAGLVPLASEWWHFGDIASMDTAKSVGDYFISTTLSIPPITIALTEDYQ